MPRSTGRPAHRFRAIEKTELTPNAVTRKLCRKVLRSFEATLDQSDALTDHPRSNAATANQIRSKPALRYTHENRSLLRLELAQVGHAGTICAWLGSYRKLVIDPSRMRSTASSIAFNGTRNHSRGFTGFPKRSWIVRSRAALPKTL